MKPEKTGWQNYLAEALQRFGTPLSNRQLQQLLQFLTLLIEWNKKMNLTAVRSVKEIISKHFLDSLVLVKFTDLLKEGKAVDVATGAGFPGLPLTIAFPQQDFTLIEAREKKCQFLQVVKKELALKNVKIINQRSELLAKEPEHRERYTNVLCRALGKMSVASEICLPFVKLGGIFIAYRGRAADSEAKEAQQAISLLGGQIKEIKPYSIEANLPPAIQGDRRHLIIIEKVSPTPERYPRRPGVPHKRPL